MDRLFLLLSILGISALAAAQTDCAVEAEIVIATEMWADEITWNIYSEAGEIVASGSNYADYSVYTTTVCMPDSCYTLELLDTFGDGWNGCSISVNFADSGVMIGPLSMSTGSYASFAVGYGSECNGVSLDGTGGGGNADVWGCMDPDANNFDPDATVNCCCTYPVDCSASNTLTIVQPMEGNWGGFGFAQITIAGEDGFPWYPSYNGVDDEGNWILEGCIEDGCYNLNIFNNAIAGETITVDILVNGELQETYTMGADVAVVYDGLGINEEGCVFNVQGCTDPEAPNYNPDATIDDGSCLEPCDCPEVYDPVCGYDFFTGQTTTYDNLCELECAGAYLQWEGDCSDQPVYGCMDPDALNYDPNATSDSGWCVYLPECDGSTLVSMTSNASVVDSLFGNVIDGAVSGYFQGSDGVNSTFSNYVDAEGNQISIGCLEDGCYNFYVYSNNWTGGGSIEVTLDGGTPESFVIGADAFSAVFPFGVNETGCEVFIPGCTDPEALNYNPNATEDDGSCAYPFSCEDDQIAGQLYVCTFSAGNEVALTIVNSQGETIYSQNGYPDLTIDYIDICLDPEECYTAIMTNLAGGNSWNGGYFWIQAGWDEWVNGSLQGASTDSIEFGMADDCGDDIGGTVYGCTDPAALNYNPIATINDGSCIYDNGGTDSLDCGGDNLVTGIFFPGDAFVNEVSWAVLDSLGNAVLTGDGGSTGNGTFDGVAQGCLPDGCYTLELYDAFGDGWGGGLLILTADPLALTFTLDDGDFASFPFEVGEGCGGSPLTIWGCTDPGATNFNPDANAEDGSCNYLFCELIDVTIVIFSLSGSDDMSWDFTGFSADGDSTWVSGTGLVDFGVQNHTLCLAPGCYGMEMQSTSAAGWEGWVEIWADGELMASATYDPTGENSMSMGIGMDCGDDPGATGGTTNAGMSGWDDSVDFSIYPTPTGEIVNILGDGFDNESPVVVRIKDMMGKLIAERTVVPADGPAGWMFNVRDWPAGIYTAEGTQGERVATGKIMVAH